MIPLRRALGRRSALAASVAGLLLLPVACGGDHETAYCSALSAKKEVFSEDSTPQSFLASLPTLEELGKKAPDDLDDEWQVFLVAMRALKSAIDAAGVQPADILDGKKPADVSDTQWAAITAAADGISAQSVADALNGIDQQAKDVCKLQLGL